MKFLKTLKFLLGAYVHLGITFVILGMVSLHKQKLSWSRDVNHRPF